MKKSLITIAGFTLAEVLITLTIIGVIAALTIPSLITDIQDQQYRTTYKKAYSDINQVTKRILMDNGGNLKGVFINAIQERDTYLNYLSYAKKCGYADTPGNCWYVSGAKRLDDGTQYMSNAWWFGGNQASGAILNSGVAVYFDWSAGFNCSNSAATSKECAVIMVDVNGLKEPNTMGKDTYFLYINEDGMKPYGATGGTVSPSVCSGTGSACSAVYLMQ